MTYAIIENGKVINVVVSEEAIGANWVALDGQSAGIGWGYDGTVFVPPAPPAQRYQVKITGLTENGVTQLNVARRVAIPLGASLGVTAQFQTLGGVVTPLNDSFNVPIFQVGGIVEKTVRATFYEGTTQLLVTFPKSGEYVVTKDGLNMHLPEESKLEFEDLFITVYSN
jgi:hypothetical protein